MTRPALAMAVRNIWSSSSRGAPVMLSTPLLLALQINVPLSTIDSMAVAFLKDHHAPSVSVAISQGDDVVFARAWGLANVELGVPATPRTVYRIGSLTKQFTAALMMQLVEEGRLNLGDSLSAFFDNASSPNASATIEHLLRHQSGVTTYPTPAMFAGDVMVPPVDLDSIARLIYFGPQVSPPGEAFAYNNGGYFLLGRIASSLTDSAYADLIDRRLVRSNGLRATTYCSATRITPDRADGYGTTNDVLVNARRIDMSHAHSAGALCSTPADLLRWTIALHAGRVLPAESYRTLTTPNGPTGQPGRQYTMGLIRTEMSGPTTYAHGGGIFGFATFAAYVPSQGLGIAVFTNLSGGPAADLGLALLRTLTAR